VQSVESVESVNYLDPEITHYKILAADLIRKGLQKTVLKRHCRADL
jgi:hypothetical protein